MEKPAIPDNEKQRLEELSSFQIIGSEETEEFDFITEMAAQICNTQVSLISLVTEDKQWFLSHRGIEFRETPREFSFCAHAIHSPEEPLIVEDARKDERFIANPLISGEPHMVFYAGIPLVSSNGYPLGTLCVVDKKPRQLTEHQISLLQKLGKQVTTTLELRKKQFQLAESNKALARAKNVLEIIQESNEIGIWELDIATGKTVWNDLVYQIHEVSPGFDHNKLNGIEFYHPDYRGLISKALEDAINNDSYFDVICLLITNKGNRKWVRSTGKRLGDKVVGSFQDITELKRNGLKFEGIFNSTMSFIGFLDPSGLLLEANNTALEAGGISRNDAVGKYFWDCYWWQRSKHIQDELKRNFEKAVSGKQVTYEVEVSIENGKTSTILFSLRPIFNERGEVAYVVAEGRPVDELVKTRDRFKHVLEGTDAGTWEWNIQTGETKFNERWAEIAGYTLEELEPVSIQTWMKLAHPDDLKESERRLNLCFERKTENYEIETRMRHKKGHWVWVLDRGKVFEWTKDGKPLKMFGTHQDITKRVTVENKLKEERNLLRTIIDISPDSIYLKDINGRKILANKMDCRYCGVENEEELLSKTDHDIYPKDIADVLYADDQKVLVHGEEILNKEESFVDKNGEKIWLLTSKIPLKNSEGRITGLVGVGRNITDRVKAEQQIIYKQKLLSQLFNFSPIGLALNDYETGAFLDINEKLIEPTGYTKDEFLSLSYWDITPKEYEPLEVVALQQMEQEGQYEKFEKEYIRKDGSRYPVSLRGMLIEDINEKKLIWSFIQDISEELEAEKKLKDAISSLQAVLDASKQVGIIATDRSGVITLFNSGAEAMLGYKAEEVVGKHTPELIYLENKANAKSNRLSEYFENEIDRFNPFVHEANAGVSETKEWTFKRKDGSTLPILLSVNSIKNGDHITGYLGVATDISLLKKVESEIKTLLHLTQEQNDRLKNFAHIVSHNLRSHSFGITGLLGLIKSDQPELFENELMSTLLKGAKNLEQTVEDLTEIVKSNTHETNTVEIKVYDVVEKNIETLSYQIKKSTFKVINKVDKEVIVNVVPAYMDSVVVNLITNSIKYKSNGKDSYLKIYTQTTETHVTIFFEDNGQGIDLRKYGEKLFGMYNTFHKHEDSRGIGLFITKNQVESMGGQIVVESEVGVGTTFEIHFPL
ncbi:MAG: PAS domain S-box protein [Balneolales bacterium]|nr:PAS domain S-box protein [Balneolales bacterium]